MALTFDEYQRKAITTDTFGGAMEGLGDFGFLEKVLSRKARNQTMGSGDNR